MLKLLKKLFASLLLLTVFITGCNLTDQQNEQNNNINNYNSENSEQTNNNEQQPPSKSTETNNSQNEQDSEQNEQKNLEMTFTVNGTEKTARAKEEHNSNQNYTMAVIDGYTFTAEEPNNDVVYVSNEDNIFMRIQLLDSNVNWDDEEANVIDQLKAISENVKQVTEHDKAFLKNSFIRQVKVDDDIVTTYLIKDHTVPLRLTLFTTDNSDHTDPFLKMAATIIPD